MGIYTSAHHRWMLFVDGENLTFRGQCYAEQNGILLEEGSSFMRDAFVWMPEWGRATVGNYRNFPSGLVSPHAIRAYYYTSVRGDDVKIQQVREALRSLGFEPKVFKRPANRNSKGVDISLTKDCLSHAFLDNYDFVALITGDGDYLPLLEEVKRLGKIVYLASFTTGLSQELRLAADWFGSLDEIFTEKWTSYVKSGH